MDLCQRISAPATTRAEWIVDAATGFDDGLNLISPRVVSFSLAEGLAFGCFSRCTPSRYANASTWQAIGYSRRTDSDSPTGIKPPNLIACALTLVSTMPGSFGFQGCAAVLPR